LAIGDDYDRIRRGLIEILECFVRFNFFGLIQGNARGNRRLFYGRAGRGVTSTARPVGLRDDSCDLKVRLCEQMMQRRQRELRSAAKDNSQRHASYHSPAFFNLRILRLIMSRFSMLK
jgi:hypothetical protein